MAQRLIRLIALVALGAALGAALNWSLDRYATFAGSNPLAIPLWYALSRPVLQAASQVAPAFLVGFLAGRQGFLLGALVGLVSEFQVIGFLRDPAFSLLLSCVYGLSAALITSLAGAAGELARRSLPPNKSFKPNPLRGSA